MKQVTKWFVMLFITAMLSACNTAGGLIRGAGKDLQTVGEWIEPNQRNRDR